MPKKDPVLAKLDAQIAKEKSDRHRKIHFQPLLTEGARSGQSVALLPGRRPCQCLATYHQLVGNCTSCGRIVCAQEGPGRCYFCGSLVCSRDQRQLIQGQSKQARRLEAELLASKWAVDCAPPVYKRQNGVISKKQGNDSVKAQSNAVEDLASDDSSDGSIASFKVNRSNLSAGAQERIEQGLALALANRDRLLGYDATSARRTRVYDDELDYFVSGDSSSVAWLSPQVRERVAKRAEELRNQRHQSVTSTFSLDMTGNDGLVREDFRDEAARKLYQPSQEELEQVYQSSTSGGSATSSGAVKTSGDNSATDSSRLSTDPSLSSISMPEFQPSLSVAPSQKPSDCQSLLNAISQPLSDRRLQSVDDDLGCHLQDNGYCLSMHQPWASLLVRGIKVDEGRTWYSSHRGPLWIASTSQSPDKSLINEMERAALASGVAKQDLPPSYPTGSLLGRVNVAAVLAQDEYREKYPDGQSESPFVFVCNDPRELMIKFTMTGQHRIYKLDKSMHLAALKYLV